MTGPDAATATPAMGTSAAAAETPADAHPHRTPHPLTPRGSERYAR